MPGDGMNDNVFSIFKMCLASFVHHRKWLEDQIHSDNALRCSIFWNESIPYSDRVGTCFPWTKTVDTPEITGLPPDVLYMAKVETLTMKFEKLVEAVLNDNNRIAKEIIEEFNRQLDLRSIGGEGYDLSREMDRKLAILLEHGNFPLQPQEHRQDAMIDDIIDGNFPVDIEAEEIVITLMSLSHQMLSR